MYSQSREIPTHRKPRAVSTEQREQARQMIIENNNANKYKEKFIGIMYVYMLN